MSSILKYRPYGFVFQPTELRLIGQAFDAATVKHPSADHNSIAAAIFKSAQSGERDPQVLLQAALIGAGEKTPTLSA